MKHNKTELAERRKLLSIIGVGSVVSLTSPKEWTKPIINSVILPAHAQTSMCVTDTTVGGPLLGNASGALTCQEACEAEAAAQNAQLCNVTESVDATNAVQCSCDLDLP